MPGGGVGAAGCGTVLRRYEAWMCLLLDSRQDDKIAAVIEDATHYEKVC